MPKVEDAEAASLFKDHFRNARGAGATRSGARTSARTKLAVVALSLLIAAGGTSCLTVQAGPILSSLDFAATVESGGKLSREQFLAVLTADAPYDITTILKGLESSDPLVRQVSALQMGEVDPRLVDAAALQSLYGAIADKDAHVADQAIASTIRLASLSPTLASSMLADNANLTDFEYESASANMSRTITLAPVDLALTGMENSDAETGLDRVLELYRNARDQEAAVTTGSSDTASSSDKASSSDTASSEIDPFAGVDDNNSEFTPGRSAYYLNALAFLLLHAVDSNQDIVRSLLSDSDSKLREVALRAASLSGPGNEAVAQSLMGIVRSGAADRDLAAAALAMNSVGRQDLLDLAHQAEPALRAVAFGALLRDADCQSPYLATALADQKEVIEAAITAMTTFDQTHTSIAPLACLARFATDTRLSDDVRDEAISLGVDALDADTAFPILKDMLSNPDSSLYGTAWRTYHGIIFERHGRLGSKTALETLKLVSSRLRHSVDEGDEELVCILRDIDPEYLVRDTLLESSLIGLIDSNVDSWIVASCAKDALVKANSIVPLPPAVADDLFTKLQHMGYLPSDLLPLINSPSLGAHWTILASATKGEDRLYVYLAAVYRGLAPADSVSRFSDVLYGRTQWLGVDNHGGSDDRDLMKEAVQGLLALGSAGRDVLAGMLRNPSVGASTREAVAANLDEGRPQDTPARAFASDVLAALHDKDPNVRSAMLDALPGVVPKPELLAVIKSLLADPSPVIQDDLAYLLTDPTPDAAAQLTAGDLESWLSANLALGEKTRVLSALVGQHSRLPQAFISESLTTLLGDPDENVSDAALKAASELGTIGITALQEVLEGPSAGAFFRWSFVTTLRDLPSAQRSLLLPDIRRLSQRFPGNYILLRALAASDNGDPRDDDVFMGDLSSEDANLREAAIEALAPSQSLSPSSRYFSALIAENTGSFLETYLGKALDQIRPYEGGIPVDAPVGGGLPDFPWPPPPWSSKEPIPIALLGPSNVTLGEASDRIVHALRHVSRDYDYGLFGIPGGIVLLARLERISADGTPIAEHRWDDDPEIPKSLMDYVVQLFLSPPGYFRVIAFAMSGQEPIATDENALLPDFENGAKNLPDEVANTPLAGHGVYALIYTFERRDGGKLSANYAGSPSGLTHLVNTGIWQALGGQIP